MVSRCTEDHHPAVLIQILKPCQAFLESASLPLPQLPDVEIDYLRLATILASPDERMDSHVIEGLHVITTVGVDSNFDELLDMSRRNFIEVDLEATACDLAARIWLVEPQILQMKDREQMVERRRKYETSGARSRGRRALEKLPADLGALQADLEGSFLSKKRGIGSIRAGLLEFRRRCEQIQHQCSCSRCAARLAGLDRAGVLSGALPKTRTSRPTTT